MNKYPTIAGQIDLMRIDEKWWRRVFIVILPLFLISNSSVAAIAYFKPEVFESFSILLGAGAILYNALLTIFLGLLFILGWVKKKTMALWQHVPWAGSSSVPKTGILLNNRQGPGGGL